MTTLVVHVLDTPDGYLPRCSQYPAWRPHPAETIDKAKLTKTLLAHARRQTTVVFFGWDERE